MDAAGATPTAFPSSNLKVVVVGAGISGIQFAHDVDTRMSNVDLQIFEKNPEAGGTGTRTGIQGTTTLQSKQDIFSWAPNPTWSKTYVAGPEIRAYLNAVIDKHHLDRFISYNQRCVSAVWCEDASQWTIKFRHEVSQEELIVQSDVFVYAVGGQDQFTGKIVHTATWPEGLSTHGKRVGVLGNGASAIQCVGALQYEADEIFNFVRSPTWVGPSFFIGDRHCIEKELFQYDSESYFRFRVELERRMSAAFALLWKHNPAQQAAKARAEAFVEENITDPHVVQAVRPDYVPGCRRWTPSEQYIASLGRSNVHVIPGHVECLVKERVRTKSSHEYPCDILICATGFEPYQPRFPVKPCESYMAAMVARFPNFFVFNPPHCPVNGSAIPGIERTADYIMRVLHRLQINCLKSVGIRTEAQREFRKWIQSRMPGMVWTDRCNSWYKARDGRVVVPWPGTIRHYYAATEIVRWEDFELVFQDPSHKFQSFGNGVTKDGFLLDKIPWVPAPSYKN
ncbi:monooxygenase [Aspergillus ellipticus CBS 707.79]|uniref:Monooxygenase n=1 Tax=Aspergillus ellipticus CBS 707.79 TaxID=1448320 RepID=A0A319D0Y5_9EURO|nr:monooxygenase [Aspergillus ellipticus CBS 707.79]